MASSYCGTQSEVSPPSVGRSKPELKRNAARERRVRARRASSAAWAWLYTRRREPPGPGGSLVLSGVRRGHVRGGGGRLRREAVVGEVDWHYVRRSRCGTVVVVVVAAAVTSEMVPGVEGEREGRIGETASDVPLFARSERRGELFGKGRLGHVFEPYGIMCASPQILRKWVRDRKDKGDCLWEYECVVNCP